MIDPGDRGTMLLATDRGLLRAEVDDLLAAGYGRAAAPTAVEGISPGVFYDLIAGSGSAGIVAGGAGVSGAADRGRHLDDTPR